ncbi:hypothetical protein K438DRAFT_1947773 [Mycena galopus ATCC 62051]|nr:hypothetical protein K438DRAFT_1947773 [Mycena galopus ATCC 62051]
MTNAWTLYARRCVGQRTELSAFRQRRSKPLMVVDANIDKISPKKYGKIRMYRMHLQCKITPHATLQTTARTAVTHACTLALCTRAASEVIVVTGPSSPSPLHIAHFSAVPCYTVRAQSLKSPDVVSVLSPGGEWVLEGTQGLRTRNDTRRWTIGGPAAAYPPRFCASQLLPALHMQPTRTDPPHVWVAAGTCGALRGCAGCDGKAQILYLTPPLEQYGYSAIPLHPHWVFVRRRTGADPTAAASRSIARCAYGGYLSHLRWSQGRTGGAKQDEFDQGVGPVKRYKKKESAAAVVRYHVGGWTPKSGGESRREVWREWWWWKTRDSHGGHIGSQRRKLERNN